ncbi:hypothetical protein PM082_003716 [Marasmius tenuissimus]|nr:hypothetical protein PM082_003716 [Marasmius tenuissimus]
MISLPESNAITFLEVVSVSLLYGISLVLFFSTVLELLRAHHANKNMLFIALMFFILSTVAAATNCYGIITAHEKVDELRDEAPPQMPVGPNPVVEWYKYTPLPVLVLSYITYTSSAVLADGVLVWRCFRVWNNKPVVAVFPCLLWVGLVVTALGNIIATAVLQPKTGSIVVVKGWFLTFLFLSLGTNLITTGLIAFKLYEESLVHRLSTSFIRRIGTVILESGIMYSVSLIVSITMCGINAPYGKIFVDMVSTESPLLESRLASHATASPKVSCIIPITFYLIILRLKRRRSTDIEYQTTSGSVTFPASSLRFSAVSGRVSQSLGVGNLTESCVIESSLTTEDRLPPEVLSLDEASVIEPSSESKEKELKVATV